MWKYCEICCVSITIYMQAHIYIYIYILKRAQTDDWRKKKHTHTHTHTKRMYDWGKKNTVATVPLEQTKVALFADWHFFYINFNL